LTSIENRTALVTGSTGFIGSHLVAALLDSGWQVRCVVRPSSNLRWLDGLSIQPITMDLTNPERAPLRKALEGVSAVFHLAGVTTSALAEGYSRVNLGGTQTMLGAVRDAAPGAHFVFCSSIAAAGPVTGRSTRNETDTPHPVSEYGKSKLAAEKAVEDSGLTHSIIRPPPVYGPRDSGIFSLFRLVSYGIAPHVGSRMQVLSIVHVSDLVRGIISAARPHANGVYYMTDGTPHTWDDVIKAIAKAVGKVPRYVAVSPGVADAVARFERLRGIVMGGKPMITPDRLLELSQNDWTCSDLRARLDLDYESHVEIAEGINSTAAWYRSNGWLAR
jgi:nucleoside-diphosphate-sugar epimerase